MRTFAKQQQALSLSSCEAELYALQLLSQESVSFGKFVHRMLFCLDEVSEAVRPRTFPFCLKVTRLVPFNWCRP